MDKNIFVARERELTQLDVYLKQVLNGQGMVCFIKGQAGSGKTALVTEFARHAQEQYGDLAVAFGQSDAQTGVGDAHLPFRELLGQLTGDVEAKLAQGAITEENASRLKKLLVLSGQALVEVGPDLIGIFVPGVGLATRVGAFAAEKAGWLDRLEHLVGKSKKSPSPGDSGIEQSHIFEQYTNVLSMLSDKHPLLLVLDDLQWADLASIGLLFHLGRRIKGHRILIIGTYRPEEVSIGRAGERHPLEKVLAEFKRYYGDIWVDLDRAIESEGQRFVNAFLDTEPNLLEEEFHRRMFQHTDGHPLFMIELLRNLQERGDLVRDSQGRWMETPDLDWESLPERVEGVIEERIGRLGQELRQMLTVGCVEGEDFTAEVVAQVQAAETRGLIQRLSGELERQHRLVMARGVRQLDLSGQRLSLYRFQHNLFQWYLYNELDEAERTYLHEDVGNALEELYGDQVDEIVVQLTRHFEEAGISEKARHYLKRAGKQAAERFANEEAIVFFNRALDLTPEDNPEELFDLLLAREQIYSLQGTRELQAKDLAALKELSQILVDDRKKVEIALRKASYANDTSDFLAAVAVAQEAICVAEEVQDTRGQALGHLEWGRAARMQGEYDAARYQLEQAVAFSQTSGLGKVEAKSLQVLGMLAKDQDDYDKAQARYEESLHMFRKVGDRRGESETLRRLGIISDQRGDHAMAKDFYELAQVVFRETGDRRSEARLLGNLGVHSFQQGNLDATRVYLEQARFISQEVGDRDSESRILANLGALCGTLGDRIGASDFLQQALVLVREIGNQPEEMTILGNLGLEGAARGDYLAASDYCDQSLRLARKLGNRWNEANVLADLGQICNSLGDYTGARDHLETSHEIARSIGYRRGETDALAHLGLLSHHLGEEQAAREYSQRALEIARELGTPEAEAFAVTHLAHALVGLDHLAEAADAYQRAIALRHELGQPNIAMESLAGLTRICLIREKPSEALTLVEEILDHLKSHTLEGTEEPFRVYLTCYRGLKANQDPRAEELLKTAYRLLQKRAAKICDQEIRRSYLEKVPTHCEIVQVYKNSVGSANLSP